MKGRTLVKRITAALVMLSVAFSVMPVSYAANEVKTEEKIYKLWYDEQAPDESADGIINTTHNESMSGWEAYQLPLGNGYMGAAVFGRTDRERVQLSDKTLHTTDKGLMNFAETYIYFNHDEASISNYYRDLNINDALASVSYDYNGVTYTREYLTSYPDNVLAIKLTASGSGNLNFSLEPMIPFLSSETSVADGTRTSTCERTGTVVADTTTNDLITLSGHLSGYEIDYEAQYRIVPTGGTMVASNTVTDDVADKGKITVTGADSAIIYVALDTNYILSTETFTKADSVKLAGNPHPHEKVTARIDAAVNKGYDAIKTDHVADVSEYFDRVKLDLGTEVSTLPTDELLANYQNGIEDKYLEELIYQYGRYLLIASSRENSLPAHLTGAWNAYDYPVCLAGYWHNINLQMNYWGVFSSNLTELFESYVKLYEAFLPDVTADANSYIKTAHPDNWDSSGNNGWGASTRVTPYGAYATRPSGIDGGGTGAMAADMLWDYYEFTGDRDILENLAYPAISGSANYMSRQMEELPEYPGLLLMPKSGSPENHVPEINADGTAFAQGWAYSNYLDTLKGAALLGVTGSDPVVSRINSQIDKIDPIQVGYSGQIKEFREETTYGQYGEWNHRHISHLIGAFPADFINPSTPAWQDAVNVALKYRGDSASWSWAYAHRMGVYARTNSGNDAYDMYQYYIKERTKPNLWGNGVFQIDGNLGIIAGVDEMLLQSHMGYIEPLAAMTDSWTDGSYDGLVARGNFVVGATWRDSQADEFRITSRNGGECNVKYRNIANATVKDSDGNTVSFTADGDVITFNTEAGKSYVITDIPTHEKMAVPADLAVEYTDGSDANITWSAVSGASKYNVYRATNSSPTYELVAENVTETSYTMDNVAGDNQYTYAVTALNNDGDESLRAVCTTIAALTPESATGTYLDSTTLQLEIAKSSTATGYRVFADGEFVMESPYSVIVLDNADSSKTYTVKAVIGELVGAEVEVASADTTVSKKALYDEIVRADAIDLSQYDETFATSITNEKNKAVAVLEKTATEAEIVAATAELKNVIDNLDMIVALSKITSSNTRIIPMDTTIAVLSHTTESTHKISSATLISALSIESGYTLSYVDANKEANASSHVTDGYVKVTKAGLDDMYIPVVKKGAVIDDNIQNNTVTNSTTNASFTFAGGIGGKAENDIAGVITAVGTPIVNMPRIHIGNSTAADATALKKLPYTIKFKVYAEGNATAAVNYRWTDANDTYRLFRWYPDGTYKYNVNGALVEGGTLAREQWHDIALVYCSQTNKYMLYVNGELQEGYSGSIAGTYYSLVYLAMENGSTNGTVAYSDLEAYYGYYYPPFKPTPEHLLSTMTSNNSNVVVGSSAISVFSHPSNATYQLSSADVVSALSADEGWTLTYVNSNKETATPDHVKSGYIKASHADYADVFIPITYKGAVIDNDHSDNAATLNGTVKATYSYADGVATFTAGSTALDNYSHTIIGNSAGSAGAISALPYTISFKMKVTGDAIGTIWKNHASATSDAFTLFQMNADGTYGYRNSSKVLQNGGTIAKDAWHDIVLVYDQPVNKFQIWVDGTCVVDNAPIDNNYFARLRFGINAGSINGTVSYKDFDTYYGYYYQPFTPTASYLLSTMTSDNGNIIVGNDAVTVYSHPTNTSHQISSSALISALEIEDGWSMSFTNSNKEAATVDHVKEGFIKATHAEYEAVYIPVTYKGAVIDNDHSDNAATYKGTTKATYAYADGVATFTAGATAIDGYTYTGIGNGVGSTGAIEKLPYTISFKMKTTGDAIGAVNWRWDGDGFEMLRVEADGTYKYRSGESLVSGGTLSKDVWHDVTLVYTGEINKFQIWVDGVCKTEDANAPTNYFAKIVFAIATGSANGTVAFKDFDTHYGYYYQSSSVDTTDGLINMKYDDRVEVDGTVVIDNGNTIVEVDGDGKLHAIGVGETTIKIDGSNVTVKVAKAKLSVVLIAGQSNAAGVHGNRNTDAVSPEVGYGYYWDGTNMADLRTHISSIDETSIGFYPALAYEWNKLTDEKVYIIHHTYSGNPLSKWASYTDGTLNTGTTATVETIEDALAAIDTSKFEIERTGYYWLQGETDAFIDATVETTMYPTAAQYQTAFTAVHNAFTEALGQGSYGAIMSCRTRHNITSYENIEFCGMRVAQQDMANQNENIFMASVITDSWNCAKSVDFTSESGMTISATTSELGANNIHYSQKGYNVLGLDAADNMFAALTEDVALTDIAVIGHDGMTVYENNSTIDVADNMRYIGAYNTTESKMAQIVARPMPISYDSTSLTFTAKDSEGNVVDGVIDNRGYIDTTKVTEDLTLTVACGDKTKTFTLINSAYIPATEDVMESMTSSNERVIVGADTITVFSHPTNTSYKLSSDVVIAALTVADGWSLSYADANKNVTTTDSVTDGYIKATHSQYGDMYIPVSAKGDDIANNIPATATYKGTVKPSYSYSDGVITFTAGETEVDGYALSGIGAGSTATGAISQLPYTLKFKMKTTGDAIGTVNTRWENDAQNLLRFNADGTYGYRNNANTTITGGSIAEDVWHDVVLVYDQPANRYQIWLDGKCLITDSGSVATGYYSNIRFCMATGSANGTVSFKDIEGYYGYYSVVEGVTSAEDVVMTNFATSDVYVKDGTEYVFVAVTTPTATEIALYNTFVCTDGETVKGIAVSDLVTTTVTGEVEIAIVVENVLKANAENFKAVFTPLKLVNAN